MYAACRARQERMKGRTGENDCCMNDASLRLVIGC